MEKRIALFIPSMRGGGAERVALSLAKGFIMFGHQVDLILVNASGPLLKDVPKQVKVIDLKKKRTILGIISLAKQIKRERYDALIPFMNHANTVAVISKHLADFKGKLILTVHGSISSGLIKLGGFKNWVIFFSMRLLYNNADKVIAVSDELKKELMKYLGLKNASCIHNPIEILNTVDENIDNEFIGIRQQFDKVIIAIGRLNVAKNYPLLIRSFYNVIKEHSAYLIILGEGAERPKLERLISDLGLSDRIRLKGFLSNPHAYLNHADLFVLSSSWEGFGLVIAEALALGKTVVSTDCHSGPSEILQNGKLGYLVPVNDEIKMTETILHALQNPLDPIMLKQRAEDFSIAKVAKKYLDLIFPLDIKNEFGNGIQTKVL